MIGQFIRRVTGQGGTLTLDDPTGWYSSDRPLFGGKEMQAMKLPAVNACIEIISDSIAKMPVYLMDSGTRERVTDHPALRLLTSRPTEALTAFDYHKLMESRRIAYGNAYALILRDKWGVPVELLPIAPGAMMPLLDSNAKLWYVGINPKTQEYRKFWPEDVLHYKAFSTDGLEGVSELPHRSRGGGRGADGRICRARRGSRDLLLPEGRTRAEKRAADGGGGTALRTRGGRRHRRRVAVSRGRDRDGRLGRRARGNAAARVDRDGRGARGRADGRAGVQGNTAQLKRYCHNNTGGE